MKKFAFRLEKVLQIREAALREKEQALARAQGELNEATERLVQLETAVRENTLEGSELMASAVFLQQYLLVGLAEKIASQRREVEAHEKRVAAAAEEYRSAAAEAKALTSLKEKKRAQYDAHMERELGKFLDELAVQRGNRSKLAE
jgi:flagellar export protein FliJ